MEDSAQAVIIAAICDLLKSVGIEPALVDQIDPYQPLTLQGVDSIDYAIIVITTGNHYDISFSDDELMDLSTLAQFAALVHQKIVTKTQ